MYTVACPDQTDVQVINITSSDNLYNAALYCEETVEADLVSPIFPETETLSVLQHRDSSGWWLWWRAECTNYAESPAACHYNSFSVTTLATDHAFTILQIHDVFPSWWTFDR